MNVIQHTLSQHCLLFVCSHLFIFTSLLHNLTNPVTQLCHFGSSVITIIGVAHFSVGVNFLAFVRMAPIGTPFIQLTCILGYFFKMLYSYHMWRWKIFLHFIMGMRGVVSTSAEIKCPPFVDVLRSKLSVYAWDKPTAHEADWERQTGKKKRYRLREKTEGLGTGKPTSWWCAERQRGKVVFKYVFVYACEIWRMHFIFFIQNI